MNPIISNSWLNNFVQYNKFWTRLITPEKFYAMQVVKTLKWEWNDDALCGTIVDKYYTEWPESLLNYPVVPRRNGNNPNEITNSMNDKIQWMIKWLNSHKTFQDFIKREWIEKQQTVKCNIKLSNWDISIKWIVDFIDHNNKELIDLKTTWKISTLWEDMQFKWTANIYHHHIRQMAFYNRITWYKCSLAIADEDNNILWVPIRQDILNKAWEVILWDLTLLNEFYNNNWNNLIIDPFTIEETKTEEIF